MSTKAIDELSTKGRKLPDGAGKVAPEGESLKSALARLLPKEKVPNRRRQGCSRRRKPQIGAGKVAPEGEGLPTTFLKISDVPESGDAMPRVSIDTLPKRRGASRLYFQIFVESLPMLSGRLQSKLNNFL